VTAYRLVVSEPERVGEPDIYRMLLDGEIDVVTFTSASTVRNFVTIIGHDQAQDLLRQTVVACIGPVTAEAAAQLGIETQIMPREYNVPALAEAIVKHYAGTAGGNAERGMRSAELGSNSELGMRK
jgi:uroporphyrinogen III methyltransferase / synthase